MTSLTHLRTRRGRFVAAIGAIGVALALSACSGTASAPTTTDAPTFDSVIANGPVADAATVSASSWASAIQKAGVLRTGGSATAALWSLQDPTTGKLTGFDAGLAQLLAKYITGAPNINLTTVTVDTRETLLQNNSVDTVFATYSITPARAQKVDFAGPYYASGAAVQVLKSNTTINSYQDLAGKTVVTQANSTGVTALQQYAPSANVITVPDNATAVTTLQQGRADAYVIDQSILIGNAVKNADLKVVGQPFTVSPYGIGVGKDNGGKAFINAWLQKIVADGTWAKLWKVTIGTVVVGDTPTPPAIG